MRAHTSRPKSARGRRRLALMRALDRAGVPDTYSRPDADNLRPIIRVLCAAIAPGDPEGTLLDATADLTAAREGRRIHRLSDRIRRTEKREERREDGCAVNPDTHAREPEEVRNPTNVTHSDTPSPQPPVSRRDTITQ